MTRMDYVYTLEKIVTDTLVGINSEDLQDITGLDKDRCEEIIKTVNEISKKNGGLHT